MCLDRTLTALAAGEGIAVAGQIRLSWVPPMRTINFQPVSTGTWATAWDYETEKKGELMDNYFQPGICSLWVNNHEDQ